MLGGGSEDMGDTETRAATKSKTKPSAPKKKSLPIKHTNGMMYQVFGKTSESAKFAALGFEKK